MPPRARLPKIVTPALLSYLRSHSTLPPQTWYYISAVALSALNRPEEIGKVFQTAIENVGEIGDGSVVCTTGNSKEQEQLRIARRMREALVKGGVVLGLPKAINALLELKACTPTHLQDPPTRPSPTGRRKEVDKMDDRRILSRGQDFFDKVYGKVSQRVMSQMDHSGTADLGIMARLMYGHILSNEAVLGPKETSFVVISGLIPQDVNPQLKGHLKGALNNGASIEEVKAVREGVIKMCQDGGMTNLEEETAGGWGWTGEVANL